MRLGQSIPIIGEFLQFTYVRNPGAAFSMGAEYTWVFSIISSLAAIFIIWFSHRVSSKAWMLALAFILGGILGNLTDRLFQPPGFWHGEVIDFINVMNLPGIFNLADAMIFVGMAIYVILIVRSHPYNKNMLTEMEDATTGS